MSQDQCGDFFNQSQMNRTTDYMHHELYASIKEQLMLV